MATAEHLDRPLALVTGVGRAGGIGAAVVRRLAGDGWDIAYTYWRSYDERMPWGADDQGREAVRRDVESAGMMALEVPADLARPESVPALFDEVVRGADRPPNALVMCHCESVASDFMTTSVASFDVHYAVNVRATWLLIREFAKRFPASADGGRILAMTSDHTVGNLPYGATKAALDRVVLAAAREFAQLRITANVINPGPTDTGWMTDDAKAQITSTTPLGRLGMPKDAADLVAFLCSPEGGWINGQLLVSDGGHSARG